MSFEPDLTDAVIWSPDWGCENVTLNKAEKINNKLPRGNDFLKEASVPLLLFYFAILVRIDYLVKILPT